ncbi:MAG: T9SS type A sorting domain-containing protein, partial [Calditrichota bacterium]
VGMLHSVCALDPDRVATQLQPGMIQEINLTLSNSGNGPLTFRTERRLIGDANAAPWELRRSYPISEITADPRIAGVAFLNDHFYVTGHAGGQHLIYVLDREGNIVDHLNQLGQSLYGMQDLAWDGEWLWGSGERSIFGFTPDGQQQAEFDGLFNPTANLAWDSDREILWASGNTTDIIGYTRQGEQVARLNRRGLRQYGLAYWPDDPDGYPLYIFNSPAGNMMVVTKMNPADNDTLPVLVLEGVGRAASVEITNELDVYSWVFVAVANADANDRIDIWQLEGRKNWMAMEPPEGVVAGGENLDMTLTLDATDLPLVRFEGEIAFMHDGIGGLTHLPITLDVMEGRVHTERTLAMSANWNMVSLNVDPDEHDIRTLWRPLVQAGLLVMLKDGAGRFYRPEFDFCNIPGWVVSEGYQVRLTEAGQLRVPGTSMMSDDPIQLRVGWQIVAYYPRIQVVVPVGFARIADLMVMAKDAQGHFYLPEWGFNNMDPLREGQGYQVRMSEAAELVWNLAEGQVNVNVNGRTDIPVGPGRSGQNGHYGQIGTDTPGFSPTGSNMSVLIFASTMSTPSALGIFAGSRLVGVGRPQGGACGIAVWGDDPLTPEIDGARPGDALMVKIQEDGVWHPVDTKSQSGEGIYLTDGLWVADLIEAAAPAQFGLTGVYPNPFNSVARVRYNLKEASRVVLGLYDLEGRLVYELARGDQVPGTHQMVLDGSDLASGVYALQLRAGGEVSRLKVTVIK